MKKTFRKLTTIVLALLFTASLPLTVLADVVLNIAEGSIAIDNINATQNDNVKPHGGTVIVTGTNTSPEHNVSVDVTSNVTVVLQDTTINTYDASSTLNDAAVEINTNSSNAVVTVELNGTNTLTSDSRHAGLEISGTGSVVIQDETSLVEGKLVDTPDGGSLTATGGTNSAGIGGEVGDSASNITITGGNVTAKGRAHGAGIGGGYEGDAGNITITGGTVFANGGGWAPGIGSGSDGSVGTVAISGGTVTATGGKGGAGIGGEVTEDTSITFSGDAQVTAIGGTGAPAIGGAEAVEPDISNLSADGWYQAVSGENYVAATPTAQAETVEQRGWFAVNARWSQSLQDGILTVTSSQVDAALNIKGWGIRGLHSSGIHTLVFVTAKAQTTLDIAKLAAECDGADVYILTHTGEKTELTCNGEIA